MKLQNLCSECCAVLTFGQNYCSYCGKSREILTKEKEVDCEKCKECENFAGNGITADCLNFKPKQHKLDELIEEFVQRKIGDGWFYHEAIESLKRLRYESIHWAMDNLIDSMGVDGSLEHHNLEDWIVK